MMKTMRYLLILLLPLCARAANEMTVSLMWSPSQKGNEPALTVVLVNHSARDIQLDPNLVSPTVGLILIEIDSGRIVSRFPLSPPEQITEDTVVVLKAHAKLETTIGISRITEEDLVKKKLVIYYDYRASTTQADVVKYSIWPNRFLSNVVILDKLKEVKI